MSDLEKKSLEAHVDLCQERYLQLDRRMTTVEQKLEKIDTDITEIKSMLNHSQSTQYRVLLGTAGGVITVLLAIVGYLFVRLV